MPIDASQTHRSRQAVRNLLGQRVKCTMDDGRVATGSLVCVDRLRNVILKDVKERRILDTSLFGAPSPKEFCTERSLSQALIPGKRLVRMEVNQSIYEEHVAPVMSAAS